MVLSVALVVASVFAVWSWARPYEWGADRGARCKVIGVEVRRDRANFWVNPHLRLVKGREHDLMKPVRLVIRDGTGREIEPADTTLGGTETEGTTDLWFKFWLDEADLRHPLELRINDGALVLKAREGAPDLGAKGTRYFVTNRW